MGAISMKRLFNWFKRKWENFKTEKLLGCISLSPKGECFMNYCFDVINETTNGRIAAYEKIIEYFCEKQNCDRKSAAIALYIIFKSIEAGQEVKMEGYYGD